MLYIQIAPILQEIQNGYLLSMPDRVEPDLHFLKHSLPISNAGSPSRMFLLHISEGLLFLQVFQDCILESKMGVSLGPTNASHSTPIHSTLRRVVRFEKLTRSITPDWVNHLHPKSSSYIQRTRCRSRTITHEPFFSVGFGVYAMISFPLTIIWP